MRLHNFVSATRFAAITAVTAVLIAGHGLTTAGASVPPASAAIDSCQAERSRGIDTTTLVLDRNGADIPEGNWWGDPDLGPSGARIQRGPDVTELNLDRDGADIE